MNTVRSALLRGVLRGFSRAGLLGPRRCPQCWRELSADAFVSDRGALANQCRRCIVRYRGWGSLTAAQRLARVRRRTVVVHEGPRRVVLVGRSHNRKTGPIPVSVTDDGSCPSSCPLRGAGCYAGYGHVGKSWRQVPRKGVPWADFCRLIAALPEGQLWRHNEAGDLPPHPGQTGELDRAALAELVRANRGRRGFTFTHHRLGAAADLRAVADANAAGFTINLSADGLEDADRFAALGIAPVAVVLPVPPYGGIGTSRSFKTPGGRTVVICPAETSGLTCATCRLCAIPNRKSLVGFRAHGQASALVSQIVQGKRATPAKKGSDR